MIEDKSEESPKVLLAAGGERGVIRILDVHRKSQYTAVRFYRRISRSMILSSFSFYKQVRSII